MSVKLATTYIYYIKYLSINTLWNMYVSIQWIKIYTFEYGWWMWQFWSCISLMCINTLRLRQMDAISQTTFSNAFSLMKMFEFQLKFHWSLFPRVQLTIFHHWFRSWLGADQATSHYLNQWWLVYWRIYASLGLNELIGLTGNIMDLQIGNSE